jgi:hypothetical protein
MVKLNGPFRTADRFICHALTRLLPVTQVSKPVFGITARFRARVLPELVNRVNSQFPMLRRKAGDDGSVQRTASARQTPKYSTAKYQKMN